MVDTSEKDFEGTIEEWLLLSGYVKRDPKNYDRTLCLDSEAVFGFLYATQPKRWEKLKVQHGPEVKTRFLKRLVKEIEVSSAKIISLRRQRYQEVANHHVPR